MKLYVPLFLFIYYTKSNKSSGCSIEERDSIAIIVPVKGTKNEFVVGADRFIYKVNWNGLENNTAKFQEILMVDESKPTNQFNDGKTDSAGRLWIGKLQIKLIMNTFARICFRNK